MVQAVQPSEQVARPERALETSTSMKHLLLLPPLVLAIAPEALFGGSVLDQQSTVLSQVDEETRVVTLDITGMT